MSVDKDLYVVMGVAGSGKSLIGAALAYALSVAFVDGDDLHSPENIERMASGVPLTDDDRASWLRGIADRMGEAKAAGTGIVVACSALKRAYRDFLRAQAGEVRFVFLTGPRGLIEKRLAHRPGHFMPPSLLDSQLAILEEPGADENVLVCDISKSPDAIVSDLMERLSTEV
jgi:gluconokinase